ncbi:MAG TPA: TadE/TadG family type IV pilus assembly protein [Candidatus Dormibacteraeota bacterium]|nr:TadE/TadG family type IV pilus assembly protein [Candidatus Dormibacteraeota bacterium]
MRKAPRGQSVVEFALVAPVFFLMLFGVIAAGYLFFQNSAIGDAAQGGAREALVETQLNVTKSGTTCESGSPESIEAAVQKAANILPVNQNPLCNYSGDGKTLTQTAVAGTASIRVVATGGLASPTSFTVTVTYVAHPLAPVLRTQTTLKSTSTLIDQSAANG